MSLSILPVWHPHVIAICAIVLGYGIVNSRSISRWLNPIGKGDPNQHLPERKSRDPNARRLRLLRKWPVFVE